MAYEDVDAGLRCGPVTAALGVGAVDPMPFPFLELACCLMFLRSARELAHDFVRAANASPVVSWANASPSLRTESVVASVAANASRALSRAATYFLPAARDEQRRNCAHEKPARQTGFMDVCGFPRTSANHQMVPRRGV